ncbi:MAG: Mur ligase family protein [Patescibacteria group bacterium]|nr:Mur ligase family protein [Patescibacteria group bacterium]
MKNAKFIAAKKFLESLVNIPGPISFLAKNRGRRRKDKRRFFIKRLRFLLKLLGNPDRNLRFIHLTGTSGKTSTTLLVSSILAAAGFKVGAFVSPHLSSVTERIHLGNKLISARELLEIIERLKPFLSHCAAISPYGCPSFFETMLAAALVYFKNNKCDYVVLEAGIGGSFDATNAIKKSAVQIITNVGLDHTDVLGKTREKIARDKAGIIKPGGKFFTAERDPRICRIFQNICRTKKVPFRRINGDYKIIANDLSGVEFEYEGEKFKTKLVGEHQAANAVLAFAAVKKIVGADLRAFKKGIAAVFVPCRLEEMPAFAKAAVDKPAFAKAAAGEARQGKKISRQAKVILDGAHNVDKMKTTAEFISKFFYRKLHLVIGLSKNKDAEGILREIVPLADRIYLTRFLHENRKTQFLGKMSQISRKLSKKKISVFVDPHEALAAAKRSAAKDDLILVTGSFFLAGELRGEWFPEEYILEKRKMI